MNIGKTPVTVTLVYKDFPKNSSVKNGVLYRLKDETWSEWSYVPYFKLTSGVSAEDVAEKISKLDMPGMDKEDLVEFQERMDFYLTPVKDIYFKSKSDGSFAKGNLNTTLCLIAIALLIIGIAYVNFINFSKLQM